MSNATQMKSFSSFFNSKLLLLQKKKPLFFILMDKYLRLTEFQTIFTQERIQTSFREIEYMISTQHS